MNYRSSSKYFENPIDEHIKEIITEALNIWNKVILFIGNYKDNISGQINRIKDKVELK